MGLQKFQIEVCNKSIISYFPGETIQGILHVVADEEKKTEGISLTFEGRARVHWTERRGGSNNSHTVSYTAEEQHMYHQVFVYGTGHLEVILPPGNHQFPFTFALPLGLPTTFDHQYGYVCYEMKAEMKRSWLINHRIKVPFAVNGILDLNMEAGVSQPLEISKYKHFCCFTCKSGPVGFILRLPKSGYVSGDFIQFTAEFSNQSSRRVHGVTASLIQYIIFRASNGTKKVPNVLTTAKGPAVTSGNTEIWSGNIMQVPTTLPSRLANCRIIDLQYFIKMEMDLQGPSINLRHEIPIIIGNVPLRNHLSQDQELYSQQIGFNFNPNPNSNLNPITPAFDSSAQSSSPVPFSYDSQYAPYPIVPSPSIFDDARSPYQIHQHESHHELNSFGTGKGYHNSAFTYSNESSSAAIVPSAPLAEGSQVFSIS